MKFSIIILIVIIAGIGFLFYKNTKVITMEKSSTSRTVSETDGVKHSIPLNEILSGGPGKDGIPSIDDPKFISTKEADEYLKDTDVGLGLMLNGIKRFYPYQILVFHEIVNDTIANEKVLVTYCPLCATGIVFDPKVNGVAQEFGVSGKLWQSNLLMYNRTAIEEDESLWSQVLGEAVLGVSTGEKLKVLPADTVQYGAWKKAHPNTQILSRETGAIRSYGRDPYGDYYTNESVSFGATFNDDRLHPKAFVIGIEIDGKFKAYERDSIKVGNTKDLFAGKNIEIKKDDTGVVQISESGNSIPHIDGFWFSWLAVHPETELNVSKVKSKKYDKVPDLLFEDYEGNTIALSDLQGKPHVINSWAVWCPFCRVELEDFAKLQEEFGDEITVIAIDRQESLSKAKGFTDEINITDKMTFLLDPKDTFYKGIGGFSMPETIFADKDGNIIVHKRGPMNLEEMRQKVNSIINN